MPEVKPLHKLRGDLVRGVLRPLKAPESCQNIIFSHFVKNLINFKHHTKVASLYRV